MKPTPANNTKVTVAELVGWVFPHGTNPNLSVESDEPDSTTKNISKAPGWPPDVFGVAALLLERSGAYSLLTPGSAVRWNPPWHIVAPAQKATWIEVAEAWKHDPKPPSVVQQLWDELLQEGQVAELSRFPGMGKPMPVWVSAALGLMIIADEASSDAGYAGPKPADLGWVAQTVLKLERALHDRIRKRQPENDGHLRLNVHNYSLTQMASLDLLAVQPKAKTAQVGATIRSMTRHLALLPPPSRMAASWQRTAGENRMHSDLTLLLVPFPYTLEADWFEGVEETGRGWGWFDLKQRWLPKDPNTFVQFIGALIVQAQSDSGQKIDGLILPEYSIRWEHHERLVEYLSANHPEIEFVVSGSRTNCEGNEGNFALTSSIVQHAGGPIITTTSRGKHHRWRLDRSQIEAYDLDQNLNPDRMWWEGIALHRRQIHTHVFRDSSSFTTFICEDLARSDPCHETVRAVGPSVVFCLLMDNVQIATRWSARYATGLSEDPGTSVLTFTSRALIERANEREYKRETSRCPASRAEGRDYARSPTWSVGLWKDDSGAPRELHCPPGDHAVLLSLSASEISETSYDDRRPIVVPHWTYGSASAVRLKSDNAVLTLLGIAEKVDD